MTRDVAVVLGASQGIGAGVARALVATGRRVVLVSRRLEPLQRLSDDIDPSGLDVVAVASDVTTIDCAARISEASRRHFCAAPRIIVHSAGIHVPGALSASDADTISRAYDTNVFVPLRVVRELLGGCELEGAHVIVINSSAGLVLNPANAVHSSAQVTMRALTDCLRADVNPLGARVTSIFCGRTASPRLQAILASEGRTFDPDLALSPADIGRAVLAALDVSARAEITEITIRPMRK